MIKIYFDWNVLNQMKNGKHPELLSLIENDERLFIPYSTSHLGDIASSIPAKGQTNPHIKTDLEFLGKVTANKFLFNTGKNVIIEFRDPGEQFEEYVEQINLFRDVSADGLFKKHLSKELSEEQTKQINQLLATTPADMDLFTSCEDTQMDQMLNMLLPGIKNNPTIGGLFDSFNELTKNLNEKEEYKDLRSLVQQSLNINKEKLGNAENPHELITSSYEKLGLPYKGIESDDKNAPLWYNKILNEYLVLDMHGYHEDKVSITNRRKETFKNTTEDAFHAAFASTCHMYVTNDNKSYQKTKAVYEKLQQETLVFKPGEFIEYFNTNLIAQEPAIDVEQPLRIIKTNNYYEEKLEGAILRHYPLAYFLFDFFNKVMLLVPDNNDKPTLLLSRLQNRQMSTFSMEIIRLSKQLMILFGNDDDDYGAVTEEELQVEEWKGRKWILKGIEFRFVRVNGHFQLYFDF